MPCSPGSVSLSGSTGSCTPCVLGSNYQDTPGAATCKPCSFCGLGSKVATSCTLTSDAVCDSCPPGYASLGGKDTCGACDASREYSDEVGQPVCSLSSPGTMPNPDHTGVVPCPIGTDLNGCLCPVNTFLTLLGERCVPIPPGVEKGIEGMKLGTLVIEPGFWRTSNTSSDVRPCPIEEACVGTKMVRRRGFAEKKNTHTHTHQHYSQTLNPLLSLP